MKIKTLYIVSAFSFVLYQNTSGHDFVMDSIAAPKTAKRSTIKFTTRLHSKGLFTYSGRISSDNPAFDINFTYDRKHWGYMFFKAIDLYDHRTNNNFALTTVYKNFHLGKIVTVTPYVGFVLEQIHSCADHGSDVAAIITTTFKLNDKLKVDNSMIFFNLILEPEYFDWVNRFRLLYSYQHTDLTFFCVAQ